jgi:hypothetical protein
MLLLEKPKFRHCGSILTVASVQSRGVKRISNCDNRRFHDKEAAWMQRHNPCRSFTILFWLLAFLMTLAVAPTVIFAEEGEHDRDDSGGHVLPGPAKPRGFSLSDMARATAFFNTGDHALDTYPHTPFQILYVPKGGGPQPYLFEVSPGTMLYVPIFYSDDTRPVVGHFPKVDDRQAVLNYVYSPTELGTIYIKIVVDDTVNSLGSDYVVGVGPVNLADNGGFGPGNHYIVFAAFLTPLNKGTHTVKILGFVNGTAWLDAGGVSQFEIRFTVIVRRPQ